MIKPLGSTILETFNFDPSLSNMREGVATLSVIALALGVLSFLLFYAFTRRVLLSFCSVLGDFR